MKVQFVLETPLREKPEGMPLLWGAIISKGSEGKEGGMKGGGVFSLLY